MAAACSLLLALGAVNAVAGPSGPMVATKSDMKDMAPPMVDKDWTIELGSGVSFSNVRSTNNASYTIVPATLTASLKLDDVSNGDFLDGIFRGNTEFFFRNDFATIPRGPENYYEGLMVGPRYNFVQPGWKIVPYVDAGVGFLFADSKPQLGGLGEDFNFTFLVGAGIKYNINDDWFVRLGVEYQHISNGGLSEPTNPNHPIDELGPKISVGYSF